MPTDTNVAQLILNKMVSDTQYDSATKVATELYLTPETPASTTHLGPVKVDGAGVKAATDGTLSVGYATASTVGGVRISIDANNVVTIYTGD